MLKAETAISRILSSLAGGQSSVYRRPEPGTQALRAAASFPIWSCSGRGFPSGRIRIRTRWALTPPFHPYLLPGGLLSVALSFPRHMVRGIPLLRDSLLCGVRTFLSGYPERLPAVSATHNIHPCFIFTICIYKKFFQEN